MSLQSGFGGGGFCSRVEPAARYIKTQTDTRKMSLA